MTINNSTRTAGPFIGNGVTADFPFSYKVFTRNDMLVAQTVTATSVETIKTIDADYTVTLNADQNSSPGGIIHMLVPPPAGTSLAATSNIPITQNLDLTNGGGFYPRVINDALDRMVIQIQQLAQQIGGGVVIGAAATYAAIMTFISNIGSSMGSSLVGFIHSGIGAVLRTLQDKERDFTNVKDYGALVNGVADDAAAITKTITARASFALGGGTSKVLSTITTQTGMSLAGAAQPKYLGPVATADVILTTALTGLTIGGPGNSIRGMHLKPVTPNQVGSIGVNGLDKYFLEMGDCLIENFETGIRQEKSLYHTYRRVDVQGGKYGMRFVAAVGAWNVAWFNNVVTMENCRLRQNSECNLDFQGQGLKAVNCDFSGGITTGAKAAVRVRAGTYDANFDSCYMEALGTGAFPYLIEGGTTRITGGFVQGGAPATRCQALVRATGGAKVIVDGLTAQDYFNNLFEVDGAGSVIYIMPGTKLGAAYNTFKSETAGGKVIDLSTFDPADKMDQSLFINDVVAIASGGTYTYQLTSSESVNIRAYLVLNGGSSLFSVTGTAVWVNLGAGTGNSQHNLVSSSGSVTVAIANATGIMTITNSSGFPGTMRFKLQTR